MLINPRPEKKMWKQICTLIIIKMSFHYYIIYYSHQTLHDEQDEPPFNNTNDHQWKYLVDRYIIEVNCPVESSKDRNHLFKLSHRLTS